MKKILLILALSASFCGAITNGVFATAGGFLNESARLSDSDWTNSTAWYAFPASLYPTAALDASPVRSNGVYAGSGCGTFDGVADWISIPATGLSTNAITIMAWAKNNGTVRGVFSSDYAMGRRTTAGDRIYLCALNQGGKYWYGAGNVFADTGVAAVTNTWNHFALVINGSNHEWYFNGVRRISATNTPIQSVGSSIAVGSFLNNETVTGSQVNFFSGQIMDAKIFNSALSSNDVYNAAHNGFCGGNAFAILPIASRWGNTIHDVSGNGNHGTLTTGAGGQDTFWGGTQTNLHWNLTKGASKVLNFNGASSSAAVNNSTNLFNFGTADFEINASLFVVSPQLAAGGGVVGKFNATGNQRSWRVDISENRALVFNASPTGEAADSLNLLSATNVFTANAWNTLTVRRIGTNITGIVNGSTVISHNTATPYAIFNGSAPVTIGFRPSASFFTGGLQFVSVSNTTSVGRWDASRAYGTTLPDSAGTNNATLVNTQFIYVPALASGTNDAAGLGLTNPSSVVHNNTETTIDGFSYSNLITNALWTVTTNAAGFITEARQP
jgi:hypothetical protein